MDASMGQLRGPLSFDEVCKEVCSKESFKKSNKVVNKQKPKKLKKKKIVAELGENISCYHSYYACIAPRMDKTTKAISPASTEDSISTGETFPNYSNVDSDIIRCNKRNVCKTEVGMRVWN